MATTSTVVQYDGTGSRRLVTGTLTAESGDTSGTVSTGLSEVHYFNVSHVLSVTSVSFPSSGGDMTVNFSDPGADATEYWMAIGI